MNLNPAGDLDKAPSWSSKYFGSINVQWSETSKINCSSFLHPCTEWASLSTCPQAPLKRFKFIAWGGARQNKITQTINLVALRRRIRSSRGSQPQLSMGAESEDVEGEASTSGWDTNSLSREPNAVCTDFTFVMSHTRRPSFCPPNANVKGLSGLQLAQ